MGFVLRRPGKGNAKNGEGTEVKSLGRREVQQNTESLEVKPQTTARKVTQKVAPVLSVLASR